MLYITWADRVLGGTIRHLPASNSALASCEARRRIVPGSPDWIRTSNLLLTEIPLLPEGLDYLIDVPDGTSSGI